jgi:guanylate kinase
MDLNSLLRRHQLSLMSAERSMTPRENRAHEQFARDYADTSGRAFARSE